MSFDVGKLSYGLELKEWKEIEQSAEDMIISCKKQIVIAEIMLQNAKPKIKKLGGKTNEEIDADAKRATTPAI